MRILIRTSKWAIWARRFGSFALPLTLIPVLMHRAGLIDSLTFEVIGIVAVTFAVLAILCAVAAFVSLWISGDRGWARALSGAALGVICLAPVGYLAFLGLRFPMLADVSTAAADPPALTAEGAPATAAANAATIKAIYPALETRTYALDATQVFALVEGLVEERGWEVRRRRVPTSPADEGQVNAIAMTPLGWRDEVAVRVRGSAAGTTVDMRSASLSALHDPGSNGERVESFLMALDAAVTAAMREAGGVPAPASDASDGVPGAETPATP